MKNVKLIYMDFYFFVFLGVDGMIGGGYSIKKEIDFCGKGYFIYYGLSSFNVGSDNSFVFDYFILDGNGFWDIIVGYIGQFIFVLKYNNGEMVFYILIYEDFKLYFDGM